MRVHDPKLRKMAHTLSLGVCIAFKVTTGNLYILMDDKKTHLPQRLGFH